MCREAVHIQIDVAKMTVQAVSYPRDAVAVVYHESQSISLTLQHTTNVPP